MPRRSMSPWSGPRLGGAVSVAGLVASLVAPRPARAQPTRNPAAGVQATRTEVVPGLYVLSTPGANLVVLLSHDTACVVGPQLPALVSSARALLATQPRSRVRFVLATPAEGAAAYGDGGWGATGAVVLAQELWRRRQGEALDARPASARPTPRMAAALPGMGFSEVVQLTVGGSDVHLIRQRPGATAGDAVVHFENAGTVYLGNVYTSDGYPMLDRAQGGSIDSMITTVAFFRRFPPTMHVVPGRGPATTARELNTYGDMLVAVRDRVRRLRDDGRTVADVIAAHPTAEFDRVWGHGAVPADRFVTSVYESLAPR